MPDYGLIDNDRYDRLMNLFNKQAEDDLPPLPARGPMDEWLDEKQAPAISPARGTTEVSPVAEGYPFDDPWYDVEVGEPNMSGWDMEVGEPVMGVDYEVGMPFFDGLNLPANMQMTDDEKYAIMNAGLKKEDMQQEMPLGPLGPGFMP